MEVHLIAVLAALINVVLTVAVSLGVGHLLLKAKDGHKRFAYSLGVIAFLISIQTIELSLWLIKLVLDR